MDMFQVNGLKKIIIGKLAEAFVDDEIICPFCDNFIDLSFNTGEFKNNQTGYVSVQCNHCLKFIAVKFFEE
ncbi:MAG TPA: hypothetical protein PKY81_12160 [bacterium]|nr:hypothetical protein [bacterium]HPN31699.1 hypothetical protein [bacterium]